MNIPWNRSYNLQPTGPVTAARREQRAPSLPPLRPATDPKVRVQSTPIDPAGLGQLPGMRFRPPQTPAPFQPPTETQLPSSMLPGPYRPATDPRLGGTQAPGLPPYRPATQYQARMGPTALQRYYGYGQARTGISPEELQFRLWSTAPPSGGFDGLRYMR